ncbi:hypothetical protein [Priestia flexa]|nr:hypothetical protein [Priestia flexa]MCA1202885.1 hypothetical protein [Priestia flexa]
MKSFVKDEIIITSFVLELSPQEVYQNSQEYDAQDRGIHGGTRNCPNH